MNGNANYLDTTQLFGFPLSDYGFGSETTGLEYSILSNMLQSPGEIPNSSEAQTASTSAEASPLISQPPSSAPTSTVDIGSQNNDQSMAIDSAIWSDPKSIDTPTSTNTSSPFAVPQGSPSAGSPQQQKPPTHYAMTKRDSVSSSGGGRRKGGSGNTPEAVYAGVKRPFNYAEGFHYLIQHVRDKMGREDLMRISRALALFRPSFIALIMNLTEEDLVFMEKCLQRTLLVPPQTFKLTATM
ncbi:Transcriptional regulator of nonfermentable carbon utilization [Umbelopsis sp. WA50703]